MRNIAPDRESPPVLHRRGRVRKRYVILIALLLLLGWGGWSVLRALTAKPGVMVDYGQQLLDMSAAAQPDGENGWPDLVAALEAFQAAGTPAAIDWPTDPEQAADVQALSRVMEGEFDAERLRFELLYCEHIRASGALEKLDAFAAHSRWVRESLDTDAASGVLFTLLPELSQARVVARARVGAMRIAAQRGDMDELVRAWRHTMSLAAAMSFDPFIISHLVGIAISNLGCEEMNRLLVEFDFDETTCQRLLDVMNERPILAPVGQVFERERLSQYDVIQHVFSDDGHGDGILLIDRLSQYSDFAAQPTSNSGSRISNLAGLVLPGRAETKRKLDEYFDLLKEQAAMSPVQREQRAADLDEWVTKLPRTQIYLRTMLPALSRTMEANDMGHAMLDSTRVLLAIESWQSRFGRLPAALDDLTPSLLPSLPADPWFGQAFVYVKREPTADDPRTFWLYSVGMDGIDNGGSEPPRGSKRTYAGDFRADGFDRILNRLREPYREVLEAQEAQRDAMPADTGDTGAGLPEPATSPGEPASHEEPSEDGG